MGEGVARSDIDGVDIFQNLPDYLAEIFEIWEIFTLIFADFATFAKLLLNFHENCCFKN